jgi:serine/threonine protein kinase
MTTDVGETLIRYPITLPVQHAERDTPVIPRQDPPRASGSIVRKRFILEEPVGHGGLGTTFRARYLREPQVHNGNPYVAIKFLDESLARRPGALRALQLLLRKSQRLAHPNIVTAFDFNRDSDAVYMATEFLEGVPLNHLIKSRQDVGLGVKDAVSIMRGVCRAMDYAHAQGVLHADFKPANALLTSSGVTKVLDFGIARAVIDLAEAQGCTAGMDAGRAGTLRLPYAGCEVLEGEAPDPRDDIYAVACVTYELITGSHPFNRLSACQAEKLRLTPKPPPGMSSGEWRALRRGLSFRRAGRPKSAMELLDGARPIGSPSARRAVIGTLAAVVLAVTAVPLWTQFEGFGERSMVAALASADPARIAPILGKLRRLEPDRRAALLVHEDARAGLIKHYAERVSALIEANEGRYDYPAAESLVRELEAFIPDSHAVRAVRERVVTKKAKALGRLREAFERDLQRDWLIPAQNAENVGKVLALVRRIDPGNPLLSDPRLPGAFAASSEQALEAGQPVLADSLVVAGLAVAPHDAALSDLRAQLQGALRDQETAALRAAAAAREMADSVAQWRLDLEEGLGQPTLTLAQARTLSHLIGELQQQGDPGAAAAMRQLETRLVRTAGQINTKQGEAAAERFTEGASALLPDSTLLRQTLEALRAAAAQRASAQRAEALASAKSATEALLAHPTWDEPWDGALQRQLAQLSAYSPQTDSYMGEVRDRAAASYVTEAARLRAAQRLDEAGTLLERSREYSPHSAPGGLEEALLADARARHAIGERKSERAAYEKNLKQQLLTQAQAGDVGSAETTLRVLRESLPANDRFMGREGPEAIAHAYERLAQTAAESGQLQSAVELIGRGRAAAPSMTALAATQARYNRYQALDDYLTQDPEPDAQRVREEIAQLYAQDHNTAQVIVPILARDFAARLHATRDHQMAVNLARAGSEIFGDGPPFRRN